MNLSNLHGGLPDDDVFGHACIMCYTKMKPDDNSWVGRNFTDQERENATGVDTICNVCRKLITDVVMKYYESHQPGNDSIFAEVIIREYWGDLSVEHLKIVSEVLVNWGTDSCVILNKTVEEMIKAKNVES